MRPKAKALGYLFVLGALMPWGTCSYLEPTKDRSVESGFQPSCCWGSRTWGFAPGWDEVGLWPLGWRR
jgi:hypothetical protein